MIEKEVQVKNRAGIHTRPAASIVKLAARFKSDVYLLRDGFSINAKSIIGVMSLAAEQNTRLLLRVEGEDEKEALTTISDFFDTGFGEL
jgi:phosphocarrier protein HPr